MDNTNEPLTRAEERKELAQNVAQMEALLKLPGWKTVQGAFAAQLESIAQEVLGAATRTHWNEQLLDGLQGAQVEAMQKGHLKGIKAVLDFPEKLCAQSREMIDTIDLATEKETENDRQDRTAN